MDVRTKALMDFLDGAHSVFHAIAGLEKVLAGNGYVCLQEQDAWELVPGGKYYVTRGGSAVIAFQVPTGEWNGFLMSASHADRPTFKVKENGEQVGAYTRLLVERYGGMLMAPWLDRPLSIAGRVLVETEAGIESKLVDIDRDLLMIPNVAIHMNRKANDGYAYNPAVDLLPLLGGKDAKGKLNALLEQEAGGKILGHDLYLYVREKARVWGVEEEYLSAQAIDDLECAWCCAQGFLKAKPNRSMPVLCVFDSEEVGSSSLQGAASNLLESVLRRICDSLQLSYDQSPEYELDIFEFDLRLTADGELILLHDSTLDRTSNAVEHFGHEDVYPGDYTLAQLKELNMGDKFTADSGESPYQGLRGKDIPDEVRVTTIQETLDYLEASGDYRYIIEIKNSGEDGFAAVDKLYAILNSYGALERTVVGTFNNEVTAYMDKTYPDLPRSAGFNEAIVFYLHSFFGLKGEGFPFVALQIPTDDYVVNLGTSKLVNYAHEHNIAVQYWTINDADEMAYLQSIGADAIMTDVPDLGGQILKQP